MPTTILTAEGAWSEDPDSQFTRSFRTHASYVRSFRRLALGDAPGSPLPDRLQGLAARLDEKLPGPKGRRPDVDEAVLFGCLHRAWGTELLLCTMSALVQDSDLVRLANSWGSVQAYYAMYGAAQALLVVEGKDRPTDHDKTQRQFVDLWVSRRIDLGPWTLAVGSPTRREADEDGVMGGPGRRLDFGIHAWASASTEDCWDLAGKALRTTRKVKVEAAEKRAAADIRKQRRKEWAEQQAERLRLGRRPRKEPKWTSPRLQPEQKIAAEKSVRPFTLMDYLYRLRVKANYEDVAMYSEGPTADGEARLFLRDLIELTSSTMLVHEHRIADLVGHRRFLRELDAWLSSHPALGEYGAHVRRQLLLSRKTPRACW